MERHTAELGHFYRVVRKPSFRRTSVIPAKRLSPGAGIQRSGAEPPRLDSGFRRNDAKTKLVHRLHKLVHRLHRLSQIYKKICVNLCKSVDVQRLTNNPICGCFKFCESHVSLFEVALKFVKGSWALVLPFAFPFQTCFQRMYP